MKRTTHLLQTRDGIRISIHLYHQEEEAELLIISPGFFKSKETLIFQRMARALAVNRAVLCMDFRGHGRSGGLYTFSALESADLQAVLVFARERYQRIGILGFSLGGAIAINTLSRFREQVFSLVTVSAPCIFEEIEFKIWGPGVIRRGISCLERGSGCHPGNPFLEKERPLDHVGQLGGLPVLIVHGDRDGVVSVKHGQRLFRQAREPKRLEIIRGGGHAEMLFREEP